MKYSSNTSAIVVRDPISLGLLGVAWITSWSALFHGFLEPTGSGEGGQLWFQFLKFLLHGVVFVFLFSSGPLAALLIACRVVACNDTLVVSKMFGLMRREYALSDVMFGVLSGGYIVGPSWNRERPYLKLVLRDGNWFAITGYARGIPSLVAFLEKNGVRVFNCGRSGPARDVGPSRPS